LNSLNPVAEVTAPAANIALGRPTNLRALESVSSAKG
jgi:hypothetical protein